MPLARLIPGSFLSRAATLGSLIKYFTRRGRWIMLPLLIFLLISGLLLILTGGLSYVAPFVYTLF